MIMMTLQFHPQWWNNSIKLKDEVTTKLMMEMSLRKKMGKVKEVRSHVKGYAQVLIRYIKLVSMWESKDDG